MDIGKDLAFAGGISHFVPFITNKVLSIDWLAQNIGDPVSDVISSSVSLLSDGVTIVRNVYKTVQCIRDHIRIHGQAKEERDSAKKIRP